MKFLGLQFRFVILILFFSGLAFSQQKKWETLQVEIKKEKDLGKKAVLKSDLAASLRFVDIKKSFQTANEAIKMSEQSKNVESQIKLTFSPPKFLKKPTVFRE